MKIATHAKQRADRAFNSRASFVARELRRIFAPAGPFGDPFGMVLDCMYVLDGKKVRPAHSMQEHFEQQRRWFESEGKECWRVADTRFPGGRVSTVFLGLEVPNPFLGPPRLFESMVFLSQTDDDESAEERWKYATWEEAEAGHAVLVAKYRGGQA